MGSSFGKLFRISTFGESLGGGVGVIVDGCPPRLELDLKKIQADLDRRRPGQSKITTPRNEDDQVEIISGKKSAHYDLLQPEITLVSTANIIKEWYADELKMFSPHTKCTVYGNSNNVVALSYDQNTDILHAGTSAGRSEFSGLVRINNTTDPITLDISASGGVVAEQ